MRRALILLALLAACARETPPEPPPGPPSLPTFREAGALIGSTTRGATDDLLGEWVVSEAVPGPFARAGSRVTLARAGEGRVLWRIDGTDITTQEDGPGRFRYDGLRLWVLWVDDGFRTAVVGNPAGTLGWIMDRPGEASPDRTEAARRMLEFNGYDLGPLAR